MTTVYLYGLGGADQMYRVIRYSAVEIDNLVGTNYGVIRTLKYEASVMRMKYPNIERVFAIDNGRGLARDYANALKTNTIESHAIFKDILEREGLELTQSV